MTQKAFLQSEASGPNFSRTASEIVTFQKKLKAFKEGTLKVKAVNFKRKSEGKFKEVEEKLIAHMKLRAKKFCKDELGLSWNFLLAKATGFAQTLGIEEGEFKASAGWLDKCLKRNGMVGIKLHGEAMEMPEQERRAIINKWKKEEF